MLLPSLERNKLQVSTQSRKAVLLKTSKRCEGELFLTSSLTSNRDPSFMMHGFVITIIAQLFRGQVNVRYHKFKQAPLFATLLPTGTFIIEILLEILFLDQNSVFRNVKN